VPDKVNFGSKVTVGPNEGKIPGIKKPKQAFAGTPVLLKTESCRILTFLLDYYRKDTTCYER
jgi:hypothetical protein